MAFSRGFTRWAGALCAALALGGCSSWRPDMQDMTAAYENSIELHQRQVILLNLLRASVNLPMSFTTIPTWTGSAGITTTAGLANQTLAQLLGSPGMNLAVDVNRNFNFTLSSLDNAEFMKGFLADIPLEQFHVFASSAQEQQALVYTLLLAGITLDPDTPQAQPFRNLADPGRFQAFQTVLQRLLAAGLTTTPQRSLKPMGPVLSKADAIEVLKAPPSSIKGPLEMVSANGPGGAGYQLAQVEEGHRFCLQPARPGATWRVSSALACGSASADASAPRGVGAAAAVERLDGLLIDVRSTRDVFKYLGQVVAQSAAQAAAGQADAGPVILGKPLLRVVQGRPAAGQLTVATVQYLGRHYFVPLDAQSHSAAVFELLSSLLAMNKITGAIPASPGILIR